MGKFEKSNRPAAQARQTSASGRSASVPSNGAQNKGGSYRKMKKAPLFVALGILLCVTIILLCVVGCSNRSGVVDDKVFVAGVDLSGMNREEATAALQAVSFDETMNVRLYTKGDSFDTYTTTYDPATEVVYDIYGKPVENAQQTVAIPELDPSETDEDAPLDENGKPYLRDTILCLPGSEVQLVMDVESAVNAALRYEQDSSSVNRFLDKLFGRAAKEITRVDLDISPYLSLNEDYIRQVLESTLENTAQEGTETVVKETIATITDKDGNPKEVDALEITIGTLTRSIDIDSLFDEIFTAYMSGNYDLQYIYNESFPEPCDLDALFEEYDCVAPVNAVCDEETYEITDGKNGFGFLLSDAVIAFESAKPGETVLLPLQELEPKYTRETLESQLFCDVLSSYDSPHVYNPTRTHNLELAAAAINGTILKPGELFSFNETVGERTADKGYGEAGVYVGGRTENQLGGGVCQVASTLFYCTLKANLEVVERAEHQFLPTYIPYGMDATIYWGSLDYKFRNNTTHPIRIDASVSDGYVHVQFIGTETKDYTVELDYVVTAWYSYEDKIIDISPDMPDYGKYAHYDEGDVIQTPYTGADVTTYMYKYDLDGNLLSSEIVCYSRYDKRDREIAHIVDEEEESTEESTEETTEAPTESTEAPTESTEPPTESTEPSTEPPTESTDPALPPEENENP